MDIWHLDSKAWTRLNLFRSANGACPIINALFHLQPGWHAWRDSEEDDWQYAEDQL